MTFVQCYDTPASWSRVHIMLIMKGLIVSQKQSILTFHSVWYHLLNSNKNDMVGLNRLVLKENLSYFSVLFYISMLMHLFVLIILTTNSALYSYLAPISAFEKDSLI